jgi:hypothetical protein
MSSDQDKAARAILTLACVGKVSLSDGKIGLVFRDVTPEGSLGDERTYEHKGLQQLRIGAVYSVEADSANTRTIYTNTFRWLRLWDKTDEAAGWQAAADAFDTQRLTVQQERKQNARKHPVELLAPIREQYWKTNPLGRLAIEVRVLAYLRSR